MVNEQAYKLLLVEDDPAVRRMYDLAFSTAGFEVHTALDGTIVYETILMNRPDIVVLDIMMPNFNGLQTLKELKKDWRTSWIPVVILSARDDQEIIQKALSLGAVRYLVKDRFEPQEVVSIVTLELEKARSKLKQA